MSIDDTIGGVPDAGHGSRSKTAFWLASARKRAFECYVEHAIKCTSTIIYLAFFLFLPPRFGGAASCFLAIIETVDDLSLARPRRCDAPPMLESDFLGKSHIEGRLIAFKWSMDYMVSSFIGGIERRL